MELQNGDLVRHRLGPIICVTAINGDAGITGVIIENGEMAQMDFAWCELESKITNIPA